MDILLSLPRTNQILKNDSALREEALIAAAKSDCEWAFAELCARHSNLVFKTIYRVTRNKEDAEDALQDCLLRAFVHLKQFDGRSRFSTWLIRIGLNSAILSFRRRRVSREVPIDYLEDGECVSHSLDVIDSSPSPEERCIDADLFAQLNDEIHKLPVFLRSPLELKYTEGLPIQEIAQTMGISIPAVKSRLFRAREILGSSLRQT